MAPQIIKQFSERINKIEGDLVSLKLMISSYRVNRKTSGDLKSALKKLEQPVTKNIKSLKNELSQTYQPHI